MTFSAARDAFSFCLEGFLYVILDDKAPSMTGYDGRRVTATLEAVHRALETGSSGAVLYPDWVAEAAERHPSHSTTLRKMLLPSPPANSGIFTVGCPEFMFRISSSLNAWTYRPKYRTARPEVKSL